MRIYRKEFGARYRTYEFGYTFWAEREKGDTPDELYENGFLPFSSDPGVSHTYYMARSACVDLKNFSFSSENRRVWRKFIERSLREEVSTETCFADKDFFIFCLAYFDAHHGKGLFTKERLKHVLSFSPEVRVFRYLLDGVRAGYVIECHGKNMRHFWFSFYDLHLTYQSFGAFLMLHATEEAKRNGISHMYLGTLYGEKALYKTNFAPLVYWDGNAWVNDLKKLRVLVRKSL